jgi:glutaredoxin|tara:strand:- start:664 stop:828 length:165 start_codon:yes stop_codon:yes gene_type:complete
MTTIKNKEETKKILEKIGFSFSSKENKKETDEDRRERIKETNASIQRVDNQIKR